MTHWSKNPELKAKVLAKISASLKGKGLGNTHAKGNTPWNKGETSETNPLVKSIAQKRYKTDGKGWLQHGYKILSIRGKEIPEHHYEWMNANNFWYIPKGYVVHHVDCNKLNNNPENLVLLTKPQHAEVHHALGTTNPFGLKA